jgi:hypothetical protein
MKQFDIAVKKVRVSGTYLKRLKRVRFTGKYKPKCKRFVVVQKNRITLKWNYETPEKLCAYHGIELTEQLFNDLFIGKWETE